MSAVDLLILVFARQKKKYFPKLQIIPVILIVTKILTHTFMTMSMLTAPPKGVNANIT